MQIFPTSSASRGLLLTAILLSFAPELLAASLIGIGHLRDGTRSEARAISADGTTIVGVATDSEFIEGQAIRWTRAGGLVALGDLPGGGKNSFASGVSSDGKVIVGTGTSENSATGLEAFFWTEEEGIRRLSLNLPFQTIRSGANAVSADGRTVVGYIEHPAREAFRWTAEEGLVLLGDLPGGPFNSEANGVSANGSVIVGNGHTQFLTEAFRWTAETGMVGLGHLTGDVAPNSEASAVSADGSVVTGVSTATNALETFRWTAATGMKSLSALAEDIPSNWALAVSADGSTIGGWAGAVEGDVAFIWTEAQGMRKLWDVLLAMGVNPAANGWQALRRVIGMSANGDLVVGAGTRNGREEGFFADLGARLNYSRVDGGLELTWPAGFRLERATTLDGDAWQSLPTGIFSLRVSFGAGSEFFRLVALP